MTIDGGDGAAPFAPASGFPVPEDVVALKASKVVKGSLCSFASGFPRRSRGRFGSPICSSDGGADAFAGSDACGFAVSGGVDAPGEVGALPLGAGAGAAEGVAGFGWSFLSAPLSESVFST